jgi:hypothetical protein
MHLRSSICALVAIALATGCGATGTAAPEAEPGGETVRIADERHGFSLTLPAGWHKAGRNLTPQLVEPREILTVATYPLRYERRARCQIAGCPTPALNGFRATDILVSIQERMDAKPAREDVAIGLRRQRTRGVCARDRVAGGAFESFSESGRSLYVFVVVGKRASPKARADLGRVLDSLHFTREVTARV